ncbi:MAG: hypothetical protein ACYC26_10130 [Phycisphaerales bacterium]
MNDLLTVNAARKADELRFARDQYLQLVGRMARSATLTADAKLLEELQAKLDLDDETIRDDVKGFGEATSYLEAIDNATADAAHLPTAGEIAEELRIADSKIESTIGPLLIRKRELETDAIRRRDADENLAELRRLLLNSARSSVNGLAAAELKHDRK